MNMNEPFGSNSTPEPNQTNQAPAEPMGWSPQVSPAKIETPATPVTTPTPASSSPFESSPIPNITGPANAPDMEPVMMEPAGSKSSVWLYVILAILVLGGLIFLVSWMNWIDFGKIMGTNKTTPTPTETVAAPIVNKNDATRKTDLANLKTALQKYFNDKQSYPVSATLTKTSDPDTALKVLVPDYITSLPLDPLSPNSFYGYKSDGKTFSLTAVLEDLTDQAGIMTGVLFLYTVTDATSETPSTSDPLPASLETPVDESAPADTTEFIDSSSESSSSSGSTSGLAEANANASASF